MGILSGISDFFGLDIGTTAVRLVQLRGKGAQKAVFRYGKMPLEYGLSDKTDAANMTRVAEVIRRALIDYNITTRNVVVGLPSHEVYSTIEDFEIDTKANLAKTVSLQLESIIPKSDKKAKTDWAILDQDIKDDANPKKSVFICSINEDFIQRRLEMLESLNLNVLAFEPDATALVRTVANSKGESNIILDVGFSRSDIVITSRNQPRFIESVNFGIAHMLRAVVNNMHHEQDVGQQLVFQVGLSDKENQALLYTSMMQSMDALLVSLQKTISFFNTRFPDYALDKLILFGDAVYIPGFADALINQLGIAVQVGDTWQNVICPPRAQADLQAIAVNFAVAGGLAERQVI